MSFVTVLEIVYQIAGRIFVKQVCSCYFEMRWMGLTLSTEMVVSCTDKRDSAECAEWCVDQRQAFTATVTDMEFTGIRDEGAADVAERWEEKIEGGFYKLLHWNYV
jgi:hypothetical protein